MNINLRLKKSNKINRCRCGRVILHIETTKTGSKNNKTETGSATSHQCGTFRGSFGRVCQRCAEKNAASAKQGTGKCERRIPLLQRLRVMKASSNVSSRSPDSACRQEKREERNNHHPLPMEVVIIGNNVMDEPCDNQGDSVTSPFEPYGQFSELGFDGITPTKMLGKKVIPTRFTFDGVVASESSTDSNSKPGCISPLSTKNLDENDFILKDLESSSASADFKRKGTRQPPLSHLRETVEKLLTPGRMRVPARTRSTSNTEVSIELSDADHYRTLGENKYNIFSPTSPQTPTSFVETTSATNKRPAGKRRDCTTNKNSKNIHGRKMRSGGKMTGKSSGWFDFGFFSIF